MSSQSVQQSVPHSISSFERLDIELLADLGDLEGLVARMGVATLRELRLARCCAVASLAPLATLARLEALELRGLRKGADLRPLAGLPRLRRLSLTNAPLGVALDLPALQDLVDLELEVGFSPSALPAALLAGAAPGLRRLDVRGVDLIASGLERLGSLESLRVQGTRGDLAPALRGLLGRLRALEELVVKAHDFGDSEPFAELPALRSLRLDGHFRRLPALPRMPALRSLAVSSSELRTLDGLPPGLPGLGELDLRGCSSLACVSAVSPLTALRVLSLGGCNAVDFGSAHRLLRRLPGLRLEDRPGHLLAAGTRPPGS